MRRVYRASFATFALVLSALEPLHAGAASAPVQTIDVAGLVGKHPGQSPGCSIAVVKNGEIVLERQYGFANLSTQRPVDATTRFRIGSVTKMFTAVSIMQLVERKQIALDARVARYLPNAPHASAITIRELLNHTSGLANYTDFILTNPDVKHPVKPALLLTSIAQKPLLFRPGLRWAYSNTNYLLLGLVVEHVARIPLAQYERAHIFAAAGMNETNAADDARSARGYSDADGTLPPAYDSSWFYGDGDLVSTAADLARFDIALLADKLVRAQSVHLMEETVRQTSLGAGITYGLGLMIEDVHGKTFVGHHGGVPGFAAENELIPRDRFAVVVLTNAFDVATAGIENAVLRAFYPQSAAIAAKDDVPQYESLTLDRAALDAYAGSYELTDGSARIAFTRNDDHLDAQLTGQGADPIYAVGTDHFVYHDVVASYRFLRAPDGTLVGVALFQNGMTHLARRVDSAGMPVGALPASPYPPTVVLDSTALDAFAGVYVGTKLTFTIARDGEGLSAKLNDQPAFPIFPLGNDRFIYKVVDAELQFRRGASGKIDAVILHQNGYIFQPATRQP